ncbi:glycoside hydrolase family 19 protein [Actinoplanes rectilineatus]|uniref:glycoside hydrolase family 19 protein n=1 Tax=Actinoplanes rectilineatus TaxID=113571 RepID=UPI00069763BB|nr:glycoside hydrolase family 19 protein [Actinoplanes rectilineatus]
MRLQGILVLVMAATAGLTAFTGQAASAAASSGTITSFANGKCLDVTDGSTANGNQPQMWSCSTGNANQSWTLTDSGQVQGRGKCLDLAENNTANGAVVHLWDCYDTVATQKWAYNSTSHDLVNLAANKCLDITGNNLADGAKLQIWECSGGANQKWNAPATGGDTPGGFVVTEEQFNQMFPNRNSFYSYSGLVTAMSAYPGFTNTGSDTTRRQEAAAFLANVNHETGALQYIVELNTANYPNYCDWGQPYGCPAGNDSYYGRGPIQLSWNYNYKAAGDALGVDLLNNPWLVQTDSAVSWMTGLWFWMTSSGAGSMTGHDTMVTGAGFGETIRTINGVQECNGGNPETVQMRVDAYLRFTAVLGVPAGDNLYC